MLTPVFALLFSGRPTTIGWRVRPVVVNAIQTFVAWSVAHVSIKIFKGQPPFTNKNTSPTIVVKCHVVLVSAAAEHSGPNTVDRFVAHAVSFIIAVFFAAARFTVQSCKVVCRNDTFSAAVALTQPMALSCFVGVRCRYCDKKTETAAFEINRCNHSTKLNALVNAVKALESV